MVKTNNKSRKRKDITRSTSLSDSGAPKKRPVIEDVDELVDQILEAADEPQEAMKETGNDPIEPIQKRSGRHRVPSGRALSSHLDGSVALTGAKKSSVRGLRPKATQDLETAVKRSVLIPSSAATTSSSILSANLEETEETDGLPLATQNVEIEDDIMKYRLALKQVSSWESSSTDVSLDMDSPNPVLEARGLGTNIFQDLLLVEFIGLRTHIQKPTLALAAHACKFLSHVGMPLSEEWNDAASLASMKVVKIFSSWFNANERFKKFLQDPKQKKPELPKELSDKIKQVGSLAVEAKEIVVDLLGRLKDLVDSKKAERHRKTANEITLNKNAGTEQLSPSEEESLLGELRLAEEILTNDPPREPNLPSPTEAEKEELKAAYSAQLNITKHKHCVFSFFQRFHITQFLLRILPSTLTLPSERHLDQVVAMLNRIHLPLPAPFRDNPLAARPKIEKVFKEMLAKTALDDDDFLHTNGKGRRVRMTPSLQDVVRTNWTNLQLQISEWKAVTTEILERSDAPNDLKHIQSNLIASKTRHLDLRSAVLRSTSNTIGHSERAQADLADSCGKLSEGITISSAATLAYCAMDGISVGDIAAKLTDLKNLSRLIQDAGMGKGAYTAATTAPDSNLQLPSQPSAKTEASSATAAVVSAPANRRSNPLQTRADLLETALAMMKPVVLSSHTKADLEIMQENYQLAKDICMRLDVDTTYLSAERFEAFIREKHKWVTCMDEFWLNLEDYDVWECGGEGDCGPYALAAALFAAGKHDKMFSPTEMRQHSMVGDKVREGWWSDEDFGRAATSLKINLVLLQTTPRDQRSATQRFWSSEDIEMDPVFVIGGSADFAHFQAVVPKSQSQRLQELGLSRVHRRKTLKEFWGGSHIPKLQSHFLCSIDLEPTESSQH